VAQKGVGVVNREQREESEEWAMHATEKGQKSAFVNKNVTTALTARFLP
jgi:hypothetical protein